jgi:hypothetical protein
MTADGCIILTTVAQLGSSCVKRSCSFFSFLVTHQQIRQHLKNKKGAKRSGSTLFLVIGKQVLSS